MPSKRAAFNLTKHYRKFYVPNKKLSAEFIASVDKPAKNKLILCYIQVFDSTH